MKYEQQLDRWRAHQAKLRAASSARGDYAGEIADLMRFEPPMPPGVARYFVKVEGTVNGKPRSIEWGVRATSVSDAEKKTIEFLRDENGWQNLDVKGVVRYS
jgi:hypothetical protein